MDIIRQITISEVILLFNLVFVLPAMALLILQLRKYERQFGPLPEETKKKSRKKKEKEDTAAAAALFSPANPDKYPYAAKNFLSAGDIACITALEEAFGPDVRVSPKVALWETIEPTEKDAEYRDRLHGRNYDFLLSDKALGQPLSAIMYRPVSGPAIAKSDEMKKICAAAGMQLVFIEQAAEYNTENLKNELGIPNFDL